MAFSTDLENHLGQQIPTVEKMFNLYSLMEILCSRGYSDQLAGIAAALIIGKEQNRINPSFLSIDGQHFRIMRDFLDPNPEPHRGSRRLKNRNKIGFLKWRLR